ncbi:MAG: hypothetical protein CSA32_03225 [Desulfobulbus propionicus]|nr:MAG: hypothetical protein CSA32_03225 [Desulfobulbus propionicus]
MSNQNWKRLAISFLLLWIGISCVAFAGMYKLWWGRERAEYLGKDAQVQRTVIWKKAGLSQKLLEVLPEIIQNWPDTVIYQQKGNFNQLSYAGYLLLPRLPAKHRETSYILSDDASYTMKYQEETVSENIVHSQPGIGGWLLSIFLVSGIVAGLKVIFRNTMLTIPEFFGLASLIVTVVVTGTRAAGGSAIPAFYISGFSGAAGWLLALFYYWRTAFNFLRQHIANKKNMASHLVFSRSNLLLFSCVLLIGISVLWTLLMSVIVVPDDWDAWAIWGAKAKVLALGSGPLSDVTLFGHKDYPLLWPSIWAFSGFCSGGWEEMWSRGWGSVFFVLCLWEMGLVIQQETGKKYLAWTGAALFASVPMAPVVVSWSYAEAPLWFLLLSSFGVLLRWKRQKSMSLLVVAALLALAAAYTKNDAMLCIVLMTFWLIMQKENHRLPALAIFSVVFVIGYSPWFYWSRLVLDLHSHAAQGLIITAESLHHAWDRIPGAARKIVAMWLDAKQWSIVLWGALVTWGLLIWQAEDKATLLLPVFMILGYFTIVVFHHDDVYWLVGTAWNRLTLQVLPILITILCVAFSRSVMEKGFVRQIYG